MKSASRRSVLRNLGALSAMAALGKTSLLTGQTTPVANPYPNDICVLLVGPWFSLSNSPSKPGSMLAMTCDDPMHLYVQGVYKGTPVTTALPAKTYEMTVTSGAHTAHPATAGSMFTGNSKTLFCIEDHAHALSLAPNVPGLRKIHLPIPNKILPAVLVPRSCGADTPLFVWPDAPKTQVMPDSTATTLILVYSGATSLSIDGVPVAKKGDHYHLEMRFKERPASPAAERAHVVSFSKKSAKMVLYNGKALNVSFDPGPGHALQMGVAGFDSREFGFKVDPAASKPAISRIDPEVCVRNYDDSDCMGAILSIDNG